MTREHAAMATSPVCFSQIAASSATATIGKHTKATIAKNHEYTADRILPPSKKTSQHFTRKHKLRQDGELSWSEYVCSGSQPEMLCGSTISPLHPRKQTSPIYEYTP